MSPYRVVESFVAERFAYVQDKKGVVDFFLAKIRSNDGLSDAQRKLLADYQNAALGGELDDTLRMELRTLVLTPLATAYTDAEALKSPEKVKEARQTRNAAAFASLVPVQNPDYATMSENDKATALLKFKVEILIAKHGHDEVWKMGITDSNLQRGADSLKVTVGNLSGEAIEFAALNFGLADGKLVESINSLSQKDYDALLVLAGQSEANDVNKPLTTALDALRRSKDMLTQVSK